MITALVLSFGLALLVGFAWSYHGSVAQSSSAHGLSQVLLPQDISQSGNVEAMFGAWIVSHGKQYASELELELRLKNFKASLEQIRSHRAEEAGYELGLTEFADMTHDEFLEHFRLRESQKLMAEECSATDRATAKVMVASGVQLPAEIDWRTRGGVSPVKNQGKCGSCWTFSTTGAIEAHLLLKTKRFVSLSEQELLDCAKAYDNNGCNGGLPSHAFQYIIENGGLSTDKAYPYEAADTGGCRAAQAKKHHRFGQQPIQLRSSFNITQGDETELEVAVGSVGPVSIAFQVAGDFRLYKSGVYTSKECKNKASDVNHAVLAVGYGTSPEGTKYWTIKNSWGTAWGEQGYFKMKRGVNMCGVAVCNSFPILA